MVDVAFEAHGCSNVLVVVLHGIGGSRKTMDGVLTAIRAERPDADIYCPDLAYAGPLGPFSRVPIERIVNDLMEAIQTHWQDRQTRAGNPVTYTAIILVGHSLGGVLARKIAILAYGETPGTPFEKEYAAYREPSPFADRINRIIMLAGLSRGWTVSSADRWMTAFIWGLLEIWGEIAAWVTGTPYTVFAVRRGAPFLVQTRLQWLALVMRPTIFQRWNPPISEPAKARLQVLCQTHSPAFDLIQLLGTQDDTVSPEDMLDNSVEMENTNYFIIEVPNSTHQQIKLMKRPSDTDRAIDQDTPEHQRYMQFTLALTTNRQDLQKIAIEWEDVSDVLPAEPEWDVTDVVFVIHGIRDKGFWTQKIARRIKQFARTSTSDPKRITDLPYRSVTASYGYFAMAPFVLQPVRIRKVAWLMDQYTEARVRFPNAKFSYVGHSNGTYLVARALKDYPAARFARILFAGSVVRSDFEWKAIAAAPSGELCQAPRVEKVLNYVATGDWVVAAFPKAMQRFKSIDLGGAGHDGFDGAFTLNKAKSLEEAQAAIKDKDVLQLAYVEGRHDAAIREMHWRDIASFVVTGTLPWLTNADTKQQKKTQDSFLGNLDTGAFAIEQPTWSKLLGKLSSVALPVLAIILAGVALWLFLRIFWVAPCLPGIEPAACAAQVTSDVLVRVIWFLAYIACIRIIVTRY